MVINNIENSNQSVKIAYIVRNSAIISNTTINLPCSYNNHYVVIGCPAAKYSDDYRANLVILSTNTTSFTCNSTNGHTKYYFICIGY